MTSLRSPAPRRSLADLLLSAAPSLLMVGVAARILDREVWWLEGRWPVLLLAGVLGTALALGGTDRRRRGPAALVPGSRLLSPDPGPRRVTAGHRPGRPVTDLCLETLRLAKMGAAANECEDAFAWRSETATYAVADGASSSFEAGSWAQLLADCFVDDPQAALSSRQVAAWLDRTRRMWWSRVADGPEGGDAWWVERPREHGAFATLLGVRIVGQDRALCWEAAAVGDSCLVHTRAGELVASFPADPSTRFGRYPLLLSSVDRSDGSSARDELARFRWATGQLGPHDTLLLMTDALAEWLLDGSDEPLRLLAEAPWAEVQWAVTAARESGSIANDDLTLLRITRN